MSVALAGIDPPMRISLETPLSVEEFWSFSAENPDLRMERAANGVELAWLIDPTRKAVEISRPGQQREIQEGHSAGEGPVGGFVLDLTRIWG